jgi:hypothetical protein
MEKIVLGNFFPSKITVGSRIIYTFYYFPGLFSIDLLSFIPKEKNYFTPLESPSICAENGSDRKHQFLIEGKVKTLPFLTG